jgi:hypothetical protein
MVPSDNNPHTDLQTGITVSAGIECLKRAKILLPKNTGFSMRRQKHIFFPGDRNGEQAVPLPSCVGSGAEELPLWQRLHCFVYRKRTDVKVLITSRLPYTLTAARAGRQVPPLLDDFAQMVGITARVVEGEETDPRFPYRVLKGLKRRNAALIPEWGGLCAASSFDDALAVVQVLEKGCRAYIDSAFLGGGFRINPVEAWLMRLVYKYKYSKMTA